SGQGCLGDLIPPAGAHRPEPGGTAAQTTSVTEPSAPADRSWLERLGLEKLDIVAILVLTGVAFVIRFFSPITPHFIAHPFDAEPPLAKEVIAAGEWADGWYRTTFQGAHGDYIDLGFNTFGWRIAVGAVGTLCVTLMYLLAFRLWRNRVFAVAAATFVCFDGM